MNMNIGLPIEDSVETLEQFALNLHPKRLLQESQTFDKG